MEKPIKGRTEDAEYPFLGADFWKPGVKVVGFVERIFKTKMDSGESTNYALVLNEPVEVDKEEQDKVSIGGLRGFQMALQCTRYQLKPGDLLVAECTSIQSPKKSGHSPRVNFAVEITPGKGYFGDTPPVDWNQQIPEYAH